MSKYTEGPFEVIKSTTGDYGADGKPQVCWDIMHCPDISTMIYCGEAHNREDAMLWASAPNMLKALDAVEKQLLEDAETHCPGWVAKMQPLYDQVLAAIEQARGLVGKHPPE